VIPTCNSRPKTNVSFFRARFVKCSVELNATYLKLWTRAWTVTEKKLVLLDYLKGRLPDGPIKEENEEEEGSW